MTVLGRLLPLAFRLAQPLARVKRGVSLGVRGAVFEANGRVLLVRHTYAPGWHFPGGGVEPGETAEEALGRELMEEGGVGLTTRPKLFGVYLNRPASRRDHVLLFVCRDWTREREPRLPTLEIAEIAFFWPAALPDAVSGGTRRRLAEIVDGAEQSADW
ncbi:MAG: NUDIX domain-containing protein [Bauldia sp.]